MSSPPPNSVAPLPLLYKLFFLYIEPFSTIVGAYFAHFQQSKYLHDTFPALATTSNPSTADSIILSQLANLYLAFTLNEALVLRATTDRRVWSTLLLVLLIADVGHLYSCKAAGPAIYYRFWEWNAMYWGNLGFVYVGATMRTCFLLRLGYSGNDSSSSVSKVK
jgi:hypothetical protein